MAVDASRMQQAWQEDFTGRDQIGLNRVNPLRWLITIFVNTFGITPPTPENETRSGKVIALMLAAVALVLGTVAWLLRSALTH
jgi:hypothetical protein